MSNGFVFVAVIFCHIVDDYYLQGILASMKQKTWWPKQEGYRDLYKNDYKMALFIHSVAPRPSIIPLIISIAPVFIFFDGLAI